MGATRSLMRSLGRFSASRLGSGQGYWNLLTKSVSQLSLATKASHSSDNPKSRFFYRDVQVDQGFRPDLIVEKQVIVEVKAVTKLLPTHEAQLLTYLRLSGLRVGLMINFHEHPILNGIKRRVF